MVASVLLGTMWSKRPAAYACLVRIRPSCALICQAGSTGAAGSERVAALGGGSHTFDLDRVYEGTTDPLAPYGHGSVPFGEPWTVTLPTRLTILRENASELA